MCASAPSWCVTGRGRALQKALTQMNVQDTVLSNLGKTGQAIVRAIVAGEQRGGAGSAARPAGETTRAVMQFAMVRVAVSVGKSTALAVRVTLVDALRAGVDRPRLGACLRDQAPALLPVAPGTRMSARTPEGVAASTARHNRTFIGAFVREGMVSSEASSTSRVNAATANSAISSVRQDTSTSPWCRSSRPPDSGSLHRP